MSKPKSKIDELEFKNYDKVLEVIEEARKKFLPYQGIMGVGFGPKESKGEFHHRDELVIIVYVQKKKAPKSIPEGQLIPKTFKGVSVDVVEPGKRKGHAHADFDNMWMDSAKIHELNPHKELHLALAADFDTDDVAVLEIDDSFLVGDDIDWAKTVQRFLQSYPDVFDFITFFVDTSSGIPGQGSWHRGVYNKTSGLNYYAGHNLDNRAAYGSTKLRAIHSISFFGNYVLLQETGHMWAAFVRNRNTAGGSNRLDLLIGPNGQGPFHWGRFFDNNHSPMDYDSIDWQALGLNLFQSHGIGNDYYHFCPLDLYLMGLIPASQVGNFYAIKSPTGNSGLISGDRKNMTVQNVIWAEGNRNPAYPNTQKIWKQAFVVLTKDAHSVHSFVQNVANQRRDYTWQFYKATRFLGKMDTTLRSFIRFPEISDITVAVDDDKAIIGWKTDVSSKGKVNFGLSPALFRRDEAHNEPFTSLQELTFGTTHGLVINGLSPDTNYYFEIIAETAEGLFDRKGVLDFCTRKTNDKCPPDIRCVTVTRTKFFGSYKVSVGWKTDELADTKVCYGTTNPPTQEMYDPYPTTEHSMTLKGLSPGSYCIVVKSKDAAGNETIDDNNGNCYTVIIPPDVPVATEAEASLSIARRIVGINAFVKTGDISKAIEATSSLFVDAAGAELQKIAEKLTLPKEPLKASYMILKTLVEQFEGSIALLKEGDGFTDFEINPDPLRLITCIKLPSDVLVHQCGFPVLTSLICKVQDKVIFEPHPTKGVGFYRLTRA